MAGQPRRLWITSSGARGYVNFEFLKITAPTVFHQRFEQGTLGSESQCSFTELSRDMHVKGGDNVFNANVKANEIDQRWCPADIFDFQLPTTGTSPMRTHVALLQQHIGYLDTLHYSTLNPHSIVGPIMISNLMLVFVKIQCYTD